MALPDVLYRENDLIHGTSLDREDLEFDLKH